MMPMALIYISLYSLSGAKVGVDLPPLLDLDAEAVQYHRDLGILADGEHQVHPALVAERGERGPGRVGDEMICGQVVGRAQPRAAGVAPARGLGASLHGARALLRRAPCRGAG